MALGHEADRVIALEDGRIVREERGHPRLDVRAAVRPVNAEVSLRPRAPSP